jgi:hypothetical protein
LGAAAVLSAKRWTWLSAISLLFTWILFGVGLSRFYVETHLLSFMLFLSAYHLIFIALGIANNFVHRRDTDVPLTGLLLLSGIGYAGFASHLMLKNHSGLLAAVFLGWGVFYLLLIAAVNYWRRQDTRLALLLLYLALGYFTVAVPVFLKEIWVTIAWSIMAVVVSVAGAHLGHFRLRQFGLLVMGLALFRLVFVDLRMFALIEYDFRGIYPFSWSDRLPAALVVVAAMLILAWLYATPRYEISVRERKLAPWLAGGANVVLLASVLTEISRYFYAKSINYHSYPWETYRNTAWSVTMGVHGFVLVVVGLWRKYKSIRWLGIGLLLATVAKIILVDLTGLETAWRILVFFCTGVILLTASYLYQSHVKKARH